VRSALGQIYGAPHPRNSTELVSEITWWTKAAAVVPLPLMALVSVVLIAVVRRAVAIATPPNGALSLQHGRGRWV
jgi:hypothetical protein